MLAPKQQQPERRAGIPRTPMNTLGAITDPHEPLTDTAGRGGHPARLRSHRHRQTSGIASKVPSAMRPAHLPGLKGLFAIGIETTLKPFPPAVTRASRGRYSCLTRRDRDRDKTGTGTPFPLAGPATATPRVAGAEGANRGRGTERHREPPARRSPAAQHRHRLEDLVPLEHGAVALTDARARAALHGRRRRRSRRAPRRRRSRAGGAAAGAHARCGSAGGGSRQPALRAAGARPAPGLLRAFPALCWGR